MRVVWKKIAIGGLEEKTGRPTCCKQSKRSNSSTSLADSWRNKPSLSDKIMRKIKVFNPVYLVAEGFKLNYGIILPTICFLKIEN